MSIDSMKRALADRDREDTIRINEMVEKEWATRVAVAKQEGEHDKARQIAVKMREKNIDSDTIFKVTDLQPDEY